MAGIDLGTWIAFFCGFVLGVLVANANARKWFAKNVRGFLGGLGKSAGRANRMYGGGMRNPLRGDRYYEDERPPRSRKVIRRKRR